MSVFVIAEAAGCHDFNLDKAVELVYLAKLAGADAVKFQWCSNGPALAARRHIDGNPYWRLQYPMGWHDNLLGVCLRHGLEYMATVYLLADVATIAPFMCRFKIASFEATDMAFITAHEPYDKPVIISMGMMDEEESERLGRYALSRPDVSLLHCVSSYPAPLGDMNLRVLRDPSVVHQGLSDHSRHPMTGALAVACGAGIIEAHVRLTTTDPSNPDYPHSFDPEGFCEYVRNIRTAETMLGDGRKVCQPSERENRKHRVLPDEGVERRSA